MSSSQDLQRKISQALSELPFPEEPRSLYEPMRYMLSLGGKRMRPMAVLMACELFEGNTDLALKAALGVEVFHNFTLLHDDIMDQAPLRRAKPTVHEKWDSNVAILSGDAMFVDSMRLIMQVPDHSLRQVLELFTKTALEVCEGQQLDMDYQSMSAVTIDQYLHMIRLKTAVLLGASLGIGALIAGAKQENVQHLYDFGVTLGVAFQLQDDILDVYADADKFGKQVGGDILANKKTYLLLTAMQQATGDVQAELNRWLSTKSGAGNDEQKVAGVKSVYSRLKVREQAETKLESLYNEAFAHLAAIPLSEERKAPLFALAQSLQSRES